MVRSYSSDAVPPEVLDRVLEVATHGPSAGFTQGVDLLVLQGPSQTRQFFELTSDPAFIADPGALTGLLKAPVVVVPLGDPGAYITRYGEADKTNSSLAGLPAASWPVPYWLVDASFSVMLLLLAATAEGLGALFFRLHRDPGPLLERLGVPYGREVVGAVALGYEAAPDARAAGPGKGSQARRARRALDEMIHRGGW
jgi:nitroreductase